MRNFIGKIKEFFKNIFNRNKVKMLESNENINLVKDETSKPKDKTFEKNRILGLYDDVKNENVELDNIDKKDLLKIRKLLLEEAKIQDEKLCEHIRMLEMLNKV